MAIDTAGAALAMHAPSTPAAGASSPTNGRALPADPAATAAPVPTPRNAFLLLSVGTMWDEPSTPAAAVPDWTDADSPAATPVPFSAFTSRFAPSTAVRTQSKAAGPKLASHASSRAACTANTAKEYRLEACSNGAANAQSPGNAAGPLLTTMATPCDPTVLQPATLSCHADAKRGSPISKAPGQNKVNSAQKLAQVPGSSAAASQPASIAEADLPGIGQQGVQGSATLPEQNGSNQAAGLSFAGPSIIPTTPMKPAPAGAPMADLIVEKEQGSAGMAQQGGNDAAADLSLSGLRSSPNSPMKPAWAHDQHAATSHAASPSEGGPKNAPKGISLQAAHAAAESQADGVAPTHKRPGSPSRAPNGNSTSQPSPKRARPDDLKPPSPCSVSAEGGRSGQDTDGPTGEGSTLGNTEGAHVKCSPATKSAGLESKAIQGSSSALDQQLAEKPSLPSQEAGTSDSRSPRLHAAKAKALAADPAGFSDAPAAVPTPVGLATANISGVSSPSDSQLPQDHQTHPRLKYGEEIGANAGSSLLAAAAPIPSQGTDAPATAEPHVSHHDGRLKADPSTEKLVNDSDGSSHPFQWLSTQQTPGEELSKVRSPALDQLARAKVSEAKSPQQPSKEDPGKASRPAEDDPVGADASATRSSHLVKTASALQASPIKSSQMARTAIKLPAPAMDLAEVSKPAVRVSSIKSAQMAETAIDLQILKEDPAELSELGADGPIHVDASATKPNKSPQMIRTAPDLQAFRTDQAAVSRPAADDLEGNDGSATRSPQVCRSATGLQSSKEHVPGVSRQAADGLAKVDGPGGKSPQQLTDAAHERPLRAFMDKECSPKHARLSGDEQRGLDGMSKAAAAQDPNKASAPQLGAQGDKAASACPHALAGDLSSAGTSSHEQPSSQKSPSEPASPLATVGQQMQRKPVPASADIIAPEVANGPLRPGVASQSSPAQSKTKHVGPTSATEAGVHANSMKASPPRVQVQLMDCNVLTGQRDTSAAGAQMQPASPVKERQSSAMASGHAMLTSDILPTALPTSHHGRQPSALEATHQQQAGSAEALPNMADRELGSATASVQMQTSLPAGAVSSAQVQALPSTLQKVSVTNSEAAAAIETADLKSAQHDDLSANRSLPAEQTSSTSLKKPATGSDSVSSSRHLLGSFQGASQGPTREECSSDADQSCPTTVHATPSLARAAGQPPTDLVATPEAPSVGPASEPKKPASSAADGPPNPDHGAAASLATAVPLGPETSLSAAAEKVSEPPSDVRVDMLQPTSTVLPEADAQQLSHGDDLGSNPASLQTVQTPTKETLQSSATKIAGAKGMLSAPCTSQTSSAVASEPTQEGKSSPTPEQIGKAHGAMLPAQLTPSPSRPRSRLMLELAQAAGDEPEEAAGGLNSPEFAPEFAQEVARMLGNSSQKSSPGDEDFSTRQATRLCKSSLLCMFNDAADSSARSAARAVFVIYCIMACCLQSTMPISNF